MKTVPVTEEDVKVLRSVIGWCMTGHYADVAHSRRGSVAQVHRDGEPVMSPRAIQFCDICGGLAEANMVVHRFEVEMLRVVLVPGQRREMVDQLVAKFVQDCRAFYRDGVFDGQLVEAELAFKQLWSATYPGGYGALDDEALMAAYGREIGFGCAWGPVDVDMGGGRIVTAGPMRWVPDPPVPEQATPEISTSTFDFRSAAGFAELEPGTAFIIAHFPEPTVFPLSKLYGERRAGRFYPLAGTPSEITQGFAIYVKFAEKEQGDGSH